MSARKLSGTLRAVQQFLSKKSPEETELVCISECNILKRDLLVTLTFHAKGNDFAEVTRVVMTTSQFHPAMLW